MSNLIKSFIPIPKLDYYFKAYWLLPLWMCVVLLIGCSSTVSIPDNFVRPAARQEIMVTPPGTLSGFQAAVTEND
jgi:hypothetical protein